MNKTFSLQQKSRSSNLDANLISRQYKLNLMVIFMRLKYENAKLKQSEKSNQLKYSPSTLQRYRNDINMLSPYRTQSNNINKRTNNASNTNFEINSHRETDVKRLQMTSNGRKTTQTKSNKKNKNNLKAACAHENIENNDQKYDEFLDDNDI